MKKRITLAIMAILVFGTLSGCSSKMDPTIKGAGHWDLKEFRSTLQPDVPQRHLAKKTLTRTVFPP